MSLYESNGVYISLACLTNEHKFLFKLVSLNKRTVHELSLYESSSSFLRTNLLIYSPKYVILSSLNQLFSSNDSAHVNISEMCWVWQLWVEHMLSFLTSLNFEVSQLHTFGLWKRLSYSSLLFTSVKTLDFLFMWL